MNIVDFTYRKPGYLQKNDLKKLNAIALHNTGNDNSIYTNTDYHMDVNGWNFLGYGYYIVDGVIYKVRGYEYMNAAVMNFNDRVISIAVQGDYNNSIPSQKDLEALQWLVDYLKQKVPSIQNVHGHNFWNDTSCPGKLFPVQQIKINKIEYVTKQQLEEELIKIRKEQREIKKILNDNLNIRYR